MDAFLRELRERVHIGVVGGSDYAKIAEQLGEGDEGERGGRGVPAVTGALHPAPRLPLAGPAVPGRELRLGPLPGCAGQAGMLQPVLLAPASALYELPQNRDSFTPPREFSPPAAPWWVPAGSRSRPSGGNGVE